MMFQPTITRATRHHIAPCCVLARYWLILTDRLLRQCVVAVLVAGGPRSWADWALRMAHTKGKADLITRTLL